MKLLHQQMIKPSLETIQVSILISHYLGGITDVRGKHIYIGIARLHSQAIRLSQIPADVTVQTEIRRRTWLSVVMSDKWSSADLSVPPMVVEDQSSLFPMTDDFEFLSAPPNGLAISTNRYSSRHSMWGQMAGTVNLFHRINEILLSLRLNPSSIHSLEREIADVADQLDEWAINLPAKLKYTAENTSCFNNIRLGRIFLGMHVGYHHYRQLLFYPFLDSRQYKQPADRISDHLSDKYLRLCKENARAVSDIMKVAFEVPGCDLVQFIYGHILVVSSSIHLYTLLFSEGEEDANMARERLISNFQILMQLKRYWPVIDLMVCWIPLFMCIYYSPTTTGSFHETLYFAGNMNVEYLLIHHRLIASAHFKVATVSRDPIPLFLTTGCCNSSWNTLQISDPIVA
jgi:hypothetical protein